MSGDGAVMNLFAILVVSKGMSQEEEEEEEVAHR